MVVAQRLRKGSCASPRGAKRLVTDALKTVGTLSPTTQLVRADSAFYGRGLVGAAVRAGTDVSSPSALDPKVKAAIAGIGDHAWQTIEYTDAVFDEATRAVDLAGGGRRGSPSPRSARRRRSTRCRVRWWSAGSPTSTRKRATARRRCLRVGRFQAFFTTTDPAETDLHVRSYAERHTRLYADKQVHADPKNSALAHLPSGKFAANAAWLVLAVIAFNLTRAAATLTAPKLARATTPTIRRTLITIPARITSLARRITLHLPAALALGDRVDTALRSRLRTRPAHHLSTQPSRRDPRRGAPWQRGQALAHTLASPSTTSATPTRPTAAIGGSRSIGGYQQWGSVVRRPTRRRMTTCSVAGFELRESLVHLLRLVLPMRDVVNSLMRRNVRVVPEQQIPHTSTTTFFEPPTGPTSVTSSPPSRDESDDPGRLAQRDRDESDQLGCDHRCFHCDHRLLRPLTPTPGYGQGWGFITSSFLIALTSGAATSRSGAMTGSDRPPGHGRC